MFWLAPLIKGIGQGILISILSFGPAFFTLIQTGITGGKKHGMRVALGIFLSELTVALICFFGLSGIFTYPLFQLVFALIAAIAILFMGVRGYSKNYDSFIEGIKVPGSSGQSFFKGFLMNLMNPFVVLLWVGLLAAVSVSYEQDTAMYRWEILINLIAILISLFAMDMGKVLLSDYLGRKLSNRVYFLVNKYFGLILLGIGAYFLYRFVVLLANYFHVWQS